MRFAAPAALLIASSVCHAESLYTRATYVMGTVATIRFYADGEAAAAGHAAAAFAELRRLDDMFTGYRDSELTRLNLAAAGRAVPASPEMFDLVRQSVELARKYSGTFDPTVGPLVRAWGFLGGTLRVPAAEERCRLRELVGFDGIVLDSTRHTIAFRRAGMELDLGGIAKGYAAEMAARLLARRGVRRALVNLGESSFFALDAPPGRTGWPVAVRDPRPPHDAAAAVIELPPFHALSTSGTYGRAFRENGTLYSHLFDPRTGEPLRVVASATVLCRSGAESDAATKPVLLLPPAERARLTAIRWLRLEEREGKLVREQSGGLP